MKHKSSKENKVVDALSRRLLMLIMMCSEKVGFEQVKE